MPGPRPVTLLLVDDSDTDREAIARAFRRLKIANPIVSAFDGVHALAKLRGTDGNPPLARPFLILLDIKMPRMDGIEFLRQLRSDEDLRDSVVFVLTTSKRDEDRLASYDLNVAGYIVKSDVSKGFLQVVEMIDHYWRIVELP